MNPEDQYNTKLSERDEMRFRMWLRDQSTARGRDMAADLHDYDLRGFFKEGQGLEGTEGHFTDKYKKPNHPTFSDESQYHGAPNPAGGKLEGGRWEGDDETGWKFIPSASMAATPEKQAALKRYFQKNEPDAVLVMPSPIKQLPTKSDRKADSGDPKAAASKDLLRALLKARK